MTVERISSYDNEKSSISDVRVVIDPAAMTSHRVVGRALSVGTEVRSTSPRPAVPRAEAHGTVWKPGADPGSYDVRRTA